MRAKTQGYFNTLKQRYSDYGDNDSLLALAEVSEMDERARTLAIYREQPKTMELIKAALDRYKVCIEKLTAREAMKMTEQERAYCHAAMDWAIFTLDVVGETQEHADNMVDEIVEGYAKRVGLV